MSALSSKRTTSETKRLFEREGDTFSCLPEACTDFAILQNYL